MALRASHAKKPTTARRGNTPKTARKSAAIIRAIQLRFKALLRLFAITCIGIALILIALAFHTIVLEHALPNQADAAPNPQPQKQSTITADGNTNRLCHSTAQSDPTFSTCPDFLVNYINQKRGSANPNLFNVYVGPAFANNEAQYYTSESANLRIEQGALKLQARAQPFGSLQYTSARFDTQGKEDFLYGKLVIRAKLPSGVGTWPAIWMLPSQPRYSGGISSGVDNGEIDIAESVGLEPHVVYGVAHSAAYPENGPDRSYYNTVIVGDNDLTFHDYEVDWTPTTLAFRIDGNIYYTYSKKPGADWRSWPFDQPFYLIINLALGGTWAGRDTLDFPRDGIDRRALPASLDIQSIRYYAYASKAPVVNR